MRRLLLIAPIFFIFIAALLFAAYYNFSSIPVNLTAEAPQCRCPGVSADAFANPQVIEFGGMKGQCIDNCKYRPPVVLSETSKSTALANVLHKDQFWLAEIKPDEIESVSVIFENFAPSIFHTALHFRMKEHGAVRMTSQTSTDTVRTRDIVLSPEAFIPKDQKYKLWDGVVGNYPIGLRVYSYEYLLGVAREKKHPLYESKLNLDGAEMSKILGLALKFGTEKTFHSVYQLFFNNCATSTVDLALAAKGLPSTRASNFVGVNLIDPFRGLALIYPIGTIRSLDWWGLAKPPSKKDQSL